MAEELIIAPFNGVVSKITKENNGQWKLTVTREGGGSVVYVLDEVYVIPCQAFSIGDSLGKKNGAGFTVGPRRLLGNPTGQRSAAIEIPLGKFLRFTPEGAIEVDLVVHRIGFVVGAQGAPEEGHTSFIVKDKLGEPIDLLNKRISFFREHDFEFSPRNYTLDASVVGKVDVVVPFGDKEEVVMDIYPEWLFAAVNSVTPIYPEVPDVVDALLISDGEALYINDTEYFKL